MKADKANLIPEVTNTMKKQELLDIILELPANQQEQLAEEIYQTLDAVEDDLNAAWIVEANNLMQRYEDTPPALPEEFDSKDEEYENAESAEVPDHLMIEDIWDCIDYLRVHLTLRTRLQQSKKQEGVPGEQVMKELEERSQQRDQELQELFGDLEPFRGQAPNVTVVQTLDDFKLHLTFEDDMQGIFNMKPYCRGMYSDLQDKDYFSWAKVHWGGVYWPNGESLWAKLLYKKSEPLEN